MTTNPCLFNGAYNVVACTLGQAFNIYRCNFAAVNQTPALIGTTMLKVSPGGRKYAIPELGGVEYFTITGDRANFTFGDILQPVNAQSQIPTITVLNYGDGFPAIGFRTSRQCSITLDINTNVYTNTYFDWVSITTPESGLIESLSGAAGVATKKCVLWTRVGYQGQWQNYEIAGMRIIESDGIIPVRYIVRGLTQIGNLTVFTVDQELT